MPLFRFWQLLRRRFVWGRWWLPRFWWAIFAAIVASVALHEPNNYDALSYRIPRQQLWLQQGTISAFEVGDPRFNFVSTGYELLTLPAVLGDSYRPVVWPNLAAFLFLPTAIFWLARGLRLPGRTSWRLMWTLPLGFGFCLQAGSIGTDLLPSTLVIVALAWALRWPHTGRWRFVWGAGLSLGLASLVKLFVLPLAAPAVLFFLAAQGQSWRRRCLAAALCSVLAVAPWFPSSLASYRHGTGWIGESGNDMGKRTRDVWASAVGNFWTMAAQQTQPPLNPGNFWGDGWQALLDATGGKNIRDHFPRFSLDLGELPQEEKSALGLPLLCFLGASVWALGGFRPQRHTVILIVTSTALLGGILLALAIEALPRLLLPYYIPLLLGLLALRPAERSERRWLPTATAFVTGGCSLAILSVQPARPLLPITALASALPAGLQARIETVYGTYAGRATFFWPLLTPISAPTDLTVFADFDFPMGTLWRHPQLRQVDLCLPHAWSPSTSHPWLLLRRTAREQLSPAQSDALHAQWELVSEGIVQPKARGESAHYELWRRRP